MADLARITAVVEPEAKALGFDLVRVALFRRSEVGDEVTTLQIMAEDPATSQLLLDQCAALSQRISARFDALEEAGEVLMPYAWRLEVSSPGIDRPLTRLVDFVTWAGHEAKVTLATPIAGNRTALHGMLAGVEDGVIQFDDRKSGRVSFALAEVRGARLVLTDRLLAITLPLDASDADELDEDEGDVALAQAQED